MNSMDVPAETLARLEAATSLSYQDFVSPAALAVFVRASIVHCHCLWYEAA
jgi:hypothetical protein